jgi:hypothetical protein
MSPRPGRITKIIGVDLPRPRNELSRESPRYFEVVTEVREALRAGGGLGLEDEIVVASAERTMVEGGIG